MSDATAAKIASEDLIIPNEGWSSFPYQDIGGVWTIGYGFTRLPDGSPVTANTPPISKQTALTWLEHYLKNEIITIHQDVSVPLNANEEAAIMDFIYNLGEGNFQASTLLKLLNKGQYEQAAAQFPLWDHVNGQVIAGLLRRRIQEEKLFLTP